MTDICKLGQANGDDGRRCDGERCIFWRAVELLGEGSGEGCALQHYELLGDAQMAAWLLSVRDRVEAEQAERAGGR